MPRSRRAAVFAALFVAASAGTWLLWTDHESTPAQAPEKPTAVGPVDDAMDAVRVEPGATVSITLPVYVPDSRGLPPVDAPLRDSYAALRSAAAGGNATAACRLAFTAMDCWAHTGLRGPAEEAAVAADLAYGHGNDHITTLSARRIAQAPPALRVYVRDRIEAIELGRAMEGDTRRARARRCEGAPRVGSDEVAGLLRQAALAGQPYAVAAYAQGEWMNRIAEMRAARTPAEPPVPLEIFRDPAFRVWRREAAAVHAAGLEAGLLPVIESAAMRNRMAWLDQLSPPDRVRQAAAVRALAARVGSGKPPSTASLGLDAGQAHEADRLSERWITASAERDATVDPRHIPANTMTMLDNPPSCE